MEDRIRMKGNHFAVRLREGNWWEEGNECLNMNDVNKPPKYYRGTGKEWVEELTTYIDLYPAEWKLIYEQYQAFSNQESILQFYRDDEGYLRIVGLDEVYLKIAGGGEPLSHEALHRTGRMLSERAEELFYSYLDYIERDEEGKRCWIESMEKIIQDGMEGEKFSIALTGTLDQSAFAGDELYFDLLNDLYMIL